MTQISRSLFPLSLNRYFKRRLTNPLSSELAGDTAVSVRRSSSRLVVAARSSHPVSQGRCKSGLCHFALCLRDER